MVRGGCAVAKTNVDALGRRRRPVQDEALRRVNEARVRPGWRTAPARHFTLPVELLPRFESLDALERSALLAEALRRLEDGTWWLDRKENGAVVVDQDPG